MGLRGEYTGIDAVLKAGKQRMEGTLPLIKEVLSRAGEVVLKKSYEFVPEFTGALKASGKVVSSLKNGLGAETTVSYGNAEAWYAAFVHEVQAFHIPPKSWKYLETAVRLTRGTRSNMLKRVVKDLIWSAGAFNNGKRIPILKEEEA